MISATNLDIGYGSHIVARTISLTLERGELTALIGRNGAGKSTLIKTITGSIPALEGEVSLNGREVIHYSRKELARLVAVVTTANATIGGLRLHELISMGRMPYTGKLGILTRKDKEIAEQMADKVGIGHKMNSFVGELSDGERQRGLIARSLAQETDVIIMDEPLTYLDIAAKLEILALLKQLAHKENKAILFSTHEVAQALRTVDKIWMMTSDRFISDTPKNIINNGAINKLFHDSAVTYDSLLQDFILKS